MTHEEIAAARDRAQQTVDGFTTPKQQHARDALKLAQTLQHRDKQLEALSKRLSKSDPLKTPSWLGDIFGPNFGR